jgi:hypothetical protein
MLALNDRAAHNRNVQRTERYMGAVFTPDKDVDNLVNLLMKDLGLDDSSFSGMHFRGFAEYRIQMLVNLRLNIATEFDDPEVIATLKV